MELLELNKKIVNKEKTPFLIFTGDETVVRDIYIKSLVTLYGCEKASIVDKFSQYILMPNLFATSEVWVVKDDDTIQNNKNTINALLNYSGDNCIILCFTKIDKKSYLYKVCKDLIVVFEPLTKEQILENIIQLITLSKEDDYYDLIGICENNFGRVLSEIDKINTYTIIKGMTPNIVLNQFIENGVISIPSTTDTSVFVNYIIERNLLYCFGMLPDLDKNDTIGILSLAYAYFRNLYLYKGYRGNKNNLAKETGLSWGLIKSIEQKGIMYSEEELKFSLQLIFKTIDNIKNGLIDSDTALYYVLVNIL